VSAKDELESIVWDHSLTNCSLAEQRSASVHDDAQAMGRRERRDQSQRSPPRRVRIVADGMGERSTRSEALGRGSSPGLI
jgi:hypothetical protein